AHALQAADDAVDDPLDALGIDRPLAAGDADRAHELVAIEGLALAAALVHGQLSQLDPLEGRESRSAIGALPPPPDRRVVLGRSRVLHLSIVMTAKRTPHRTTPPF